MPKKLLIIESSDIGARYTAEAAKELNLEPVFLCRLRDYQGDTRKQILQYEHVDLENSDTQSILQYVRDSKIEVGGVVSLLDSYLAVACEVSKKLNCPGIDLSVLKLRDKAQVVELIPDFSPRSITFDRSVQNQSQLENFFKTINGDIIVKPRFAAGAFGFNIVPKGSNIESILKKIRELKISEHISPNLWIAQEKIEGQVMSLEGFVINGTPTKFGFTATSKVGNTQSKCFFPYDKNISTKALNFADIALAALVKRSGFLNGYVHTEFIINGEKAILIDANFGRVGGGGVGEHIALSSGLNPVQVFKHFLSVTLNGIEPFKLNHQMMMKDTKAYLYGISSRGKIIDIKIDEIGNGFHTRILDPGAMVGAMGENNWSWIGILTGETNLLDDQLSKISIKTEKGWERPIC